MPVWVWFVLAGIVSSAIMTVKTAREDRKQEMAWIEEEGMKFMNRMEEEKRKRSGLLADDEEVDQQEIII
ncbi:sporulation YhaL family protein [Peribacillus sp. SCS-37]|uniref:sporulation YhaL family protein n=1 Tax=Paraperibacillus esterisolvens TaxID=3115296 RepID=UPI003906A208